MTIGSQIKLWRESAGLSQRELAAALGVVQSAVGNWEAARTDVSRERLASIARVCRIDDSSVLAALALPQLPQ